MSVLRHYAAGAAVSGSCLLGACERRSHVGRGDSGVRRVWAALPHPQGPGAQDAPHGAGGAQGERAAAGAADPPRAFSGRAAPCYAAVGGGDRAPLGLGGRRDPVGSRWACACLTAPVRGGTPVVWCRPAGVQGMEGERRHRPRGWESATRGTGFPIVPVTPGRRGQGGSSQPLRFDPSPPRPPHPTAPHPQPSKKGHG